MARAVDADVMLAELKPIDYETEHSTVLISDVAKIMREWVERQPTLTSPNEPEYREYTCPYCYHTWLEDRDASDYPNYCPVCRAVLRDGSAPPNEPLTLEQLREMDGEPVWIVEHPDWGHWELSADAKDYIADRDQDLYGLKHDDPAGQCGLHVLGWLAYRRPPEGET